MVVGVNTRRKSLSSEKENQRLCAVACVRNACMKWTLWVFASMRDICHMFEIVGGVGCLFANE